MNPGAARAEAHNPHVGRVPGEPGLWILILGEMTIFSILFGVFLSNGAQENQLFEHSRADLNRTIGLLNTLWLLSGSWFVVLALEAVRAQDLRRGPRLFLGAMFFGLLFVFFKIVEYSDLIAHGKSITTNDFYTFYFVLTGLHLIHVVVGLIVLGVLAFVSKRPIQQSNRVALAEGGCCFWHMVDMIWIILFPLLYLI